MRAAWVVLCSLLTWTTLVVCFVVWLPIMAVLHAVERPFDSGLYRTGRFFRLMGIVIARANPLWHFRAEGYVPPDPRHPFVVVSNHESFADILLTCFLPWEMKWLGKAELFRIPIMGQVMWLAGDIPVRRGERTSAREAMAACRDRLRKRVSVMIYPEGTRTRTGEMLPFKDAAWLGRGRILRKPVSAETLIGEIGALCVEAAIEGSLRSEPAAEPASPAATPRSTAPSAGPL